ncbi:plasmid segregation centromere-binding protein ParG [Shewanella psychrophila]|uniref:Plasmid segregation centromere-binding protein ParG n=1 Tax=Shewanella psychrophila TaxID=225848 RepID=A0A1S6HU12_9GAMM|nr:CopG family transcriptional regulator [Shewanella psychrophila]AQS38962.1 plasmid segregation centromere-binding protein ParG [Shewanella psychrophila]
MGLADLKKNSTQSNSSINKQRPMQMSLDALIDDFIDDASLYAAGHSSSEPTMEDIMDLASRFTVPDSVPTKPKATRPAHREPKSSQTKGQRNRDQAVLKISKGDEPYRKATFTLSESAISHLAEIASGCDIAKSKLIRFLIEHHYSLNEEERKQKESCIIVD